MKLPKKIASLLTITLVAGSGFGNLKTVEAARGLASETLIGNGRWETAIEISKKEWKTSKEAVIVNDSSLADALTATPFAEAKNAPILLTQNNKLDDRTKAELKRLGVEKVYLIGGEAALNKSVEDALKSEKISVDRIQGKTRYETSLEIAKRLDSIKDISEIAVVNGTKGIVDAISIAPVAAEKDMAIILSHPGQGTKVSDDFIKGEDIKTSYIIGGETAVSEEVANKLPNAKRLDGQNRNETNAKVIETFYTENELKNAYVAKDGITKESELIDGLAVGVLAAKNNSPVILVRHKLNENQKDVLNTKSFKTITQVGGGSNENAFNELKDIQDVTVYNVSTIEELNDAIAKSNANDVINMAPTTRADIDEEVSIKTSKKIEINLSGNYKNTVTISAPNASLVNQGTISKLVVKDSVGGNIKNASGATISNIEVQGSASNIDIVNDGTITDIKNDATGTQIENNGNITNPPTGNQAPDIESNKTEVNVDNLDSLKEALANKKIKTINITQSIAEINETIEINRPVDIKGQNGATLTFVDSKQGLGQPSRSGILINEDASNTTISDLNLKVGNTSAWSKTYALKIDGAKNIKLNNVLATGGHKGIVVNNSDVELKGNIDVSGNYDAGIEILNASKLTIENANLKNTTEINECPTILVAKDQSTVVEGSTKLTQKELNRNQTGYYLSEESLERINVSNESQLRYALADKNIKTINLTGHIVGIEETIKLDREVTIDGNGKTLEFTKNINRKGNGERQGILVQSDNVTLKELKISTVKENKWQGVYGIQVYDATGVKLEDITSLNSDAGILVNGSEVLLSGTIDVSNNEFGGIEVLKGSDAKLKESKLTIGKAKLVNSTETHAQPTIWLVDNQGSVVGADSLTKNITIKPGQTQYYLDAENADTDKIDAQKVSTEEELRNALNDINVKAINIINDIKNIKETIEVNREVAIFGNGNTLYFTEDINTGENVKRQGILVNNANNVKISRLGVHVLKNSVTGTNGWTGSYGFQVYNATGVTLEDVSAMGTDAGILVNSSEVELKGNIDVTGNEFGGIKVSKGSEVGLKDPKLTVTGKIEMDRYHVKPVIWIDGYSCDNQEAGLTKDVVDLTKMLNLNEISEKLVSEHDNTNQTKGKHQYHFRFNNTILPE